MGAGVGAGVGLGVGAAVGQFALCDWLPRQFWADDRCRYFFPNWCAVPSVLDCLLGVFCVVLQLVQPLQPL